MLDAYKSFWLNYTNFIGRTTRSGFWYVFLCNLIIGFIVVFIYGLLPDLKKFFDTFLTIYGLAAIIPSISICVRRLHDINKSGWYYFMYFIPLVGPIIFLVYLCTASVSEGNSYGDVTI